MITEIAIAPFGLGKSTDDLSKISGAKNTFERVIKQKGSQGAFWGPTHEDPQVLRSFFLWDSLDDHTALTKTE